MLTEVRPINMDVYKGLVATLADSITKSNLPMRQPVKAGLPNPGRGGRGREEMELNKILIRGMDEPMIELAGSRSPFGLIRHSQRDNPSASPAYETFDPFDPSHYTDIPRELAYRVLAECLEDTLSDSLGRRLWGISQDIEQGDISSDSARAFQRLSQLKGVSGPYTGQEDLRFKKLFSTLPAAAYTIPTYLKGIAYASSVHGISLPPSADIDIETVRLFEEIAINTHFLTVDTARLHSEFAAAEFHAVFNGFLDDTSGSYDHSFVLTLRNGKIALDYEPAFWTFKSEFYQHYGFSEEEGCPALQVPSAATIDGSKQQSLISSLWQFSAGFASPLYRFLYLS